jgi:hypothetical protein
MNCEYCEKTFKSKYNLKRHIDTCKSNPNKKIMNTYSETDMLKKEIELLKNQLLESEKARQSNFNNFEIMFKQYIKLQESIN